MRCRRPVVVCDGVDGDECGTWEIDFDAETVSSVNGIRVSRDAPAPGWVSTADGEFCPEHAQVTKEPEKGAFVRDKLGHLWVRSTSNGKWHCRGCLAGNVKWSSLIEKYGPLTVATEGGA